MRTSQDLSRGRLNVYSEEPCEDSHLLHFIWSGREIRPAALNNILAWAKKTAQTDWSIILWTDKVTQTWSTWTKFKLYAQGVKLQYIDVTDVRQEFWPTYKALVREKSKNFPAASDLARYSILQKYGGVYLDVDIGPGTFELPREKTFRRNDLPWMAPQLRDLQAVRAVLKLPKDTKVTPQHIKEAARSQMVNGIYNNNFIVSHKNSAPMEAVIAGISRTVADYGGAKTLLQMPDNAAITTGPGPVKKALIDYIEKLYGVQQMEANDMLTGAMYHDVELEWLTEESEEQEH